MRFTNPRILVNQLISQLANPLNTFLSTSRTSDKDLNDFITFHRETGSNELIQKSAKRFRADFIRKLTSRVQSQQYNGLMAC